MNIKCPNCQTAYVVPDSKVGDKPKRMRCSRCNEVFTVKRRSKQTPMGYQEYTGQQEALPKEFAFLKAAQPDGAQPASLPPMARPSQPAEPVRPSEPPETLVPPPPEQPCETTKNGPPPPRPPASAPEPERLDFEDFSAEVDSKSTQPGFGKGGVRTQPVPSDPPVMDVSFSEPPAPARPPGGAPDPVTQTAHRIQPAVPAAARPSPALESGPRIAPSPAPPVHGDIFGGGAWETETPLDLGGYAMPSEKSQKIGKIMAIFSGVVMLIMVFVLYRNGWDLSLGELPEQLAFAFSGREREILPDEVADLETTMAERRLLSAGSRTYLIVTGTVFNNAPVPRSGILLRGTLIDSTGDRRAAVELPCDSSVDDTAIRNTPPGQIIRHYQERGAMRDCKIKQESSASYQLVFESAPADYNDSFEIEVKPIFAR